MSVHEYVVVVGSTMMDMVAYTSKIPQAGETVSGDSFALGFGGKGANQAVMARRLGATVSMINTLGDDLFGDSTLANFQEEGIDTSGISQAHGASGVAPIWVEPDGSNRIICVAGANDAMTPAGAISALEHLENYQIVIGQLEIPQEVTIAAFKKAKDFGAITILNPAPFALISPDLISVSDWIIPNESEFAEMHSQGLGPTSDKNILEIAATLKARFVVTLGEKGAAFTTRDGEIRRVAAPQVKAIDTTGAGDAFVGAFAVGLASSFGRKGNRLRLCVRVRECHEKRYPIFLSNSSPGTRNPSVDRLIAEARDESEFGHLLHDRTIGHRVFQARIRR